MATAIRIKNLVLNPDTIDQYLRTLDSCIISKKKKGASGTVKQIMAKHSKLVNTDRTKNSADLFIIACARTRS